MLNSSHHWWKYGAKRHTTSTFVKESASSR
ncbi:unnamed protein product [Linum tenue]|uniref:Uncharacterized protein n=1 Tax=Linum tenue TaxID=586396 RepID=A0AAV0L5Q1_9ROSI|nr:unnamed protein product [Linum tenue]